jgi:hypothetical protein
MMGMLYLMECITIVVELLDSLFSSRRVCPLTLHVYLYFQYYTNGYTDGDTAIADLSLIRS